MSSNRPYLLRALYEWINDNNMTPYVLADAKHAGVQVPKSAIKDGKVVLNIAMRAVASLSMTNDALSFSARFSGVSQSIYIPIPAVIAIYAQETGSGMMLPPDNAASDSNQTEDAEHSMATSIAQDDKEPPPPKGGHLRIVK